jgi:hypothetical protein
LLNEDLSDIMEGVKGVSLVEETPVVDPNLLFHGSESSDDGAPRAALEPLDERQTKTKFVEVQVDAEDANRSTALGKLQADTQGMKLPQGIRTQQSADAAKMPPEIPLLQGLGGDFLVDLARPSPCKRVRKSETN